MRRSSPLFPLLAACALLLLLPAAPARAGEPMPHHDLRARVEPDTGRLAATDRLHVPRRFLGEAGVLEVRLHAGLSLFATDPAWHVEPASDAEEPGGAPSRLWRVRPAAGPWPAGDVVLPLRYEGTIRHPLQKEQEEYARSFSRTPGTISAEGVVLTGATGWVPSLGEDALTFTLTVDVPKGWDAVSQGSRTLEAEKGGRHVVTWDCPHPMEEVYLIAARWTEYDRKVGPVLAQAYLREPDEALAGRYLEATDAYIGMYGRLIGPYPFGKFALVENFWDTGYGMPSFTLLGPRVIRFPFILTSSYPHEILHNWWGNSVYVDWQTGNWCEGLTAYMADHLIQEGRGEGARYRRDTLKKYRNYVDSGRDFPLTAFHSRHSSATEAVGYGKALMVFHMARRRLGDAAFKSAIRAFYGEEIWHHASWADLARAFSAAGGDDFTPWIETWTRRAGAPTLAIQAEAAGENDLAVTLLQTQEGDVWPVDVPVAVTIEGRKDAVVAVVPMREKRVRTTLHLPARPLRVDADPMFDVFRRLDLSEVPATLGEVFGAERVTIVVPTASNDPLAPAWSRFAETWKSGAAPGAVDVVGEDALETLPADRAVWVLGETNRWAGALAKGLARHDAGPDGASWRFGSERVPRSGHGVAYVTRPTGAGGEERPAIGWVATDVEASLPGLARKLPHYGRYSYLAFEGDEPTNVVKGEWSSTGSPLTVLLAGDVPRAALPAREPLARPEPLFDADRLMAHVRTLADDALEGRGVGTAGLAKAAQIVAKGFETAGLEPAGTDGFFQPFEVQGGPDGKPVTLENVVGVLPGRDPALADHVVVVGAHYDHLGYGWPDVREGQEGKIHNGADDNASGVAVLLELARRLVEEGPSARSVVFVAFSGEEWGLQGSRYFVAHSPRWPLGEAIAMVNMDTVGRLGEGPLLVLGTGSATEWPHVARGVGFTTGIASKPIDEDPQGSDQVAFREIGVPAIQLFTGAHEDYHRPTDDVEKIDAEGLVKVATWAHETIRYLADRPTPLTPAGETPSAPPPGPKTARKVLLGTVPAFDYQGEGIRVESVVTGSPAEKAGIRAGDVLLAIDGKPLTDLRTYANVLRDYADGDVITVRLRRDGEEIDRKATLEAR